MDLHASTFEPRVGDTFRAIGVWDPHASDEEVLPVCRADGAFDPPVELILHKVTAREFGGPFEQFRLTFRAASTPALEQDTFVLDHDTLGLEPLLLVPSSDDGETRTYEASISVPRPLQRTDP